MEVNTVYFENPGKENTEAVFDIARRRAEERGINTILVASTTGETAVKAVKALKGLKVIAVSHVAGFRGPGTQEFTEANKKTVEAGGGTVLTAAHTFSGVSRAPRTKLNTVTIGDIIANTLRIFGQGTKVACEIAMMAADAGLVRADEEVICIGGSASGADTAVVLKPVNSNDFFDLKVKEILCKPRL